MVDVQDEEGTENIALHQLGLTSGVQPPESGQNTASSEVQLSATGAPVSSDPRPPSVHTSPGSRPTSVVDNSVSTPEESRSASPATTIDPFPRTDSNLARDRRASSTGPEPRVKVKTLASRILDLKYPIIATMAVGFTASLLFTTDYQYAPLGTLGASSGILILNLLGKGTDYSLAASAGLMWETLQLRPLLRGGEQLLTYFALGSGASLASWVKILLPRGSHSIEREIKRIALWNRARFWSIIRLLSWAALQFPGIIVLAVANPQTEYYPTNWTIVSGGIGLFDPNASASGSVVRSVTAGLITTSILRDTTRSYQVDPISEECIAAGDSCTSYLIPGGLLSISPWPFQKANDRETYYMTKDEPAYQVDFWTPKDEVVWSDDACKPYGSTYTALKLCVDSSMTVQGQILSGWRPCHGDITPSGSCPYANSSSEASQFRSTAMSIYRRTARITASRTTYTIVQVSDLSPPILQDLSPANFTTAFDGILLPWTISTSNLCYTQTPQYILTSYVATLLTIGLNAPVVPLASDSIRNLFATVIYLFNPLIDGLGPHYSISTVAPGLPTENYFNGSLAVSIDRIVPARWTAYAYTVVATTILGLVLLSQGLTINERILETSNFALVDAMRLRYMRSNETGDEVEMEDLRDAFEDVVAGDDGEIVRRAREVRVLAREEDNSGAARRNGSV